MLPVRFLPAHNALLQEALAEAAEKQYHSARVRVFRPEHLVAIMLQTGRDKDRQRFATFMREASLDWDYLAEVIARHQLGETFNRWKTTN